MARKKTLECFEVNEKVFYSILENFKDIVVQVEDIDIYYKGCKDKGKVYYDGFKTIVCLEMYLDFVTPVNCTENWKQCIIQLNAHPEQIDCQKSIDGTRAWARMMLLLSSYYSTEEIRDLLNSYQAEYDDKLKQQHYWYNCDTNVIYEFHNCYKWDINGAHNDALCEIFPKARKVLTKHYDTRHQFPIHKKEVNYFVGMLKRKGFKNTYNWIVQRTTELIFQLTEVTTKNWDSELLYVNTDCILVQNPSWIPPVSEKLGMFKLEYQGTVYMYKDKNYIIMELDHHHVGSCLYTVRDRINLEEHRVVHYDRVLDGFVYKALNQQEDIIDNVQRI